MNINLHKKLSFGIAVTLFLSLHLVLIGCAATNPEANNTPNTTQNSVPNTTPNSSPDVALSLPEDADSLIPTPGGNLIYKGNLNGYAPVPTVTRTFTIGTDNVSVTYRADIETLPGSTRNNIISIFDTNFTIRYNGIGPQSYLGAITLAVSGLPSGITADIPGPQIQFHIADSVKPGEYSFTINVNIDGTDYQLPCTIKVV